MIKLDKILILKNVIKKFSLVTDPNAETRMLNNYCHDLLTVHLKAYAQKIDYREMSKKACIKALHQDIPIEKVYILNSSGKLLSEFTGKNFECQIKIPSSKNLVIIHGHPKLDNELTLPISLQDFKVLNDYKNIDEIIAVDLQGNESILRKTNKFKQLKEKDFLKLENVYKNYLIEKSDNKEKILELIDYCKQNKDCKSIICEITELINKSQYTKNGIESIDKFWREISDNLGIKYLSYDIKK